MSDFELRADVARSRAVLDEAERWAGAAGADAVEVAVLGQRGLLEMRAGDPAAALRALDRAGSRLAAAEPVDGAVVLLNRGSLHLELGHLRRARIDLEQCVARADALGDSLLAFKARHNLGYLEFLEGDLPAALRAMEDAARLDHGGSPAVALLDRAQVLMEAGLLAEADEALASAEGLFAEQRLGHDLAQVQLARARCSLLRGIPRDAERRAQSARRRFLRRGNRPWAARAELVAAQARLAELLTDLSPSTAALRAVARRARAAGDDSIMPVMQRVAALTAAEALLTAGDLERAAAALADSGRLSPRDPLTVWTQAHVVRAGLALALGERATASRHVRAGQARLSQHRRMLGSVEAVTAAAAHGERLASVDIAGALATGSPPIVLDALERGRATFAGPARVRPPADPVLAELLARLRRCVAAQRAIGPEADDGARAEQALLRREAARLTRLLREARWRLGDGSAAPPTVRCADLQASLPAGATVVDLLVHRGTVHAVVVDAQRAGLVTLGDLSAVQEVARRVRADFVALANPAVPRPLRDAVQRSLRRGLTRLDTLLLEPLGRVTALHIVAPGPLVTLPWGLLPSRAGLATSVGTRLVAAGTPTPRGSGVVAVAGPGLAQAEAEVRGVADAWRTGRAVVGERATVAEVTEALRSASVVHLAAHGRHEQENPLFSWMRLVDGPLFAYELDGTTVPGTTVVLSACELGQATVRPGGEVLGLASVLLRLGAGTVVAALAPVRDETVAAVMPVLHRSLAVGSNPAQALAEACSGLDEPLPLTCFTLRPGLDEA